MKILALGDPHGKLPKNLKLIIKKNKIGIIIVIGEIFPIKRYKDNSGQKHRGFADLAGGEKILDKIGSYKIPIILLKGNMFNDKKSKKYFRDLINKYNKKYSNLYYKQLGKLNIKGINFIIFDMIYEEHSHQYLSKYFTSPLKNQKRLERLNRLLKKNKDAILLSHAPPYEYLDKIHSGKHIGSKILLKVIENNSPKLVLCGHIHEAKGKAKIGKTEIYNLGCCGDYKIFNL